MTAELRIVDAGGTHELATVELLHRMGYLEAMGVRVKRTYVFNGAEAAELLLAGEADAAIQVGFGPALSAIARGAPLRVIAACNLLTVHAIYSQQPDIRRLEDLPGRAVGVGKLGALTHQLITAALIKRGVDPATVNVVPIGNSAAIFKALIAGKVEAGFGETEIFDHQAQYGVHALEGGVLWRELPEFPNQASFASERAIHDKRDALVRVLAAHGLLYRCLQDPESWDDYAAAWVRALPDSGREEGHSQWRFYQDNRPFAEDLMLPPERVAYLQALNVTMGLQRDPLPYESIADMSLAHDALRLIGDPARHLGGTSV